MTQLNPYVTPRTADPLFSRRVFPPQFGLLVGAMWAALFAGGVLLALAQAVSPALSLVLMPRFGWAGLWDCAYPLIFLLPWLRSRRVGALLGAAWLCVALGTIHAVVLITKGTVATVANPFNDRLHSSWYLDVLPLFLAGACLLAVAWWAPGGAPSGDLNEAS